jgi:hypothetical protein
MAVLSPSVIFTVYFAKQMGIEILKVAAGKSTTAFRFITCGSWDITEFKKTYMAEMSDDEISSDGSVQQPNADKLRGFKYDGNTLDDNLGDLSGKPLKDQYATRDDIFAQGDKSLKDLDMIIDHNEIGVSIDDGLRYQQSSSDASGGTPREPVNHESIDVDMITEERRQGYTPAQNFAYSHELEFNNESSNMHATPNLDKHRKILGALNSDSSSLESIEQEGQPKT